MRLVTLALCLATLLTGCASGTNLAWSNPGASEQAFYQARAQCMSMAGPGGQQIATAGVGGGAFNTGFNQSYNQVSAVAAQRQRNQIFEDCMRGQGWRLVRQ